jgi:CheY-like chemotaxis protein
LTVEVPPEPLWVVGDAARLAQILSNLLNNAAKYTPSGGRIRLSVTREQNQAVFCVRDTGVGISSEMIGKVFDLFEQVDRSIDRSQGGLGIGLTLVHRLVELHGGKVEAASEGPGQGAEFTVRLPLAAEEGDSEAADNPAIGAATAGAEAAPNTIPGSAGGHQSGDAIAGDEPLAARRPSSTLRVLVVDDNVDAADALAELLRLSGHDVRLAYDGPSAVEAALTFHPAAVVLDLGLPGLNGFEVARHLREHPKTRDAMLIAVSGYGQEEDRRRSKEAGFEKHFVKPLDFQVLSETLLDVVPRRTAAGGSAVAAR